MLFQWLHFLLLLCCHFTAWCSSRCRVGICSARHELLIRSFLFYWGTRADTQWWHHEQPGVTDWSEKLPLYNHMLEPLDSDSTCTYTRSPTQISKQWLQHALPLHSCLENVMSLIRSFSCASSQLGSQLIDIAVIMISDCFFFFKYMTTEIQFVPGEPFSYYLFYLPREAAGKRGPRKLWRSSRNLRLRRGKLPESHLSVTLSNQTGGGQLVEESRKKPVCHQPGGRQKNRRNKMIRSVQILTFSPAFKMLCVARHPERSVLTVKYGAGSIMLWNAVHLLKKRVFKKKKKEAGQT